MIALDTNVLIYCCDRRDPRRQLALAIVSGAADGVLPWQVACEFIAASRKLADRWFTAAPAWQRLAESLALFPLIMPAASVLERARVLHLEQR